MGKSSHLARASSLARGKSSLSQSVSSLNRPPLLHPSSKKNTSQCDTVLQNCAGGISGAKPRFRNEREFQNKCPRPPHNEPHDNIPFAPFAPSRENSKKLLSGAASHAVALTAVVPACVLRVVDPNTAGKENGKSYSATRSPPASSGTRTTSPTNAPIGSPFRRAKRAKTTPLPPSAMGK